MTDEEINRRIAEIQGWTIKGLQAPKLTFRTLGKPPGGGNLTNIPSYATDLNAMHATWESSIKGKSGMEDMFAFYVSEELGFDARRMDEPDLSIAEWQEVMNAPSRVRAIAFLRTHGMEVEG